MKEFYKIALILLIFLGTITSHAQVKPKDACHMDEGRLVFTLDTKWTIGQKQELARLFDLDSSLMAGVWAGKKELKVGGVVWSVKKLSDRLIELSKPLGGPTVSGGSDNVIMIDDQMAGIVMESTRESVPYGINKFTRYDVFSYLGGKARFFIPGHQDASHIILSGTFNNWSTLQMPMTRNDSGWTIQMKLKPGKYEYKYIIDGRWTPDPYNRQRENDLNGGENSVVFCFNHWFKLGDHLEARKVIVAGSFNNWNEHELKMVRSRNGWMLQMYLREGTHAYKFLIDGNWMMDPACKIARPDGAGHMNSFLGIGDSALFVLKGYPDAKKVVLSGNFNAWNAGELYMIKTKGGWCLPYALAPGVYEYKFIVDGEWITDPDNPLKVGAGEGANSVFVFQPNYTFTLIPYSDAKKVSVAGSFNGWNKNAYQMIRKDFKWVFPIRLKPGKYTYKFVVDGKWILDPGNDLWEENEYGTGNSVLWIEP